MIDYLERVWGLRYFWLSLVRLDLRTRYRRSALGIGWALLQPLGMATVISIVFSSLFNMSAREFPMILAGLCVWNFIGGSTSAGCHCFTLNENYIRQFPAPLAIYPLRVALGSVFHLSITLTMVLGFSWVLRTGPNFISVASLIPSLLLMGVLGWSISTLMAVSNTRFPDLAHISDVVLQMLFYATPIVYPASMLRERGMGWLIDVNPFAAVLAMVRMPILDCTYPPLPTTIYALGFCLGLASLASLALARSQNRLIYQL